MSIFLARLLFECIAASKENISKVDVTAISSASTLINQVVMVQAEIIGNFFFEPVLLFWSFFPICIPH